MPVPLETAMLVTCVDAPALAYVVVVVRVWRGLGVIEDLELGGRPIRDVARERLRR